MRLIDADALKALIIRRRKEAKTLTGIDMVMVIDDAPTVDAAPVVHGQWIHCEGKSSIWYCSVCGDKIIYNPTRKTYKPSKKPVSEINKYCRNCGARMDLEEQDAKKET